MNWQLWLLVVLGILAIITLGLLSLRMAKRIDRLHRRVESNRVNLNRQLIKRAAETMRTADLVQVPSDRATEMRRAATDEISLAGVPLVIKGLGSDESNEPATLARLRAESDLSEVLRVCMTEDLCAEMKTDPVSGAQLEALIEACNRAELIRTLHNQDVSLTLALRDRRLPKALHLAGSAELPHPVELDDRVFGD
ncbi:hypothetical protein U6G28_09085 [Actinomycetaceae bacterium MB13-C1-2]|nr:hypothetical protein U6G28_09085 [Actinomycetaceae bacterium MB13-C1-2]